MEVEGAPEPSDIIWENLSVTKAQARRNTIKIDIIIFIVLLIIFTIFGTLKSVSNKSSKIASTYGFNCD